MPKRVDVHEQLLLRSLSLQPCLNPHFPVRVVLPTEASEVCPEVPLEEANANVQGSEKLVWGRSGTCRGIWLDMLPATQVCQIHPCLGPPTSFTRPGRGESFVSPPFMNHGIDAGPSMLYGCIHRGCTCGILAKPQKL